MLEATTVRGKILEEARRLTEGDRNKAYGSPDANLECFAGMVEHYLALRFQGARLADSLTAVDGAIILLLLKVSRVAANQKHADNYTDMAAYSAIAGECAGVFDGEVAE